MYMLHGYAIWFYSSVIITPKPCNDKISSRLDPVMLLKLPIILLSNVLPNYALLYSIMLCKSSYDKYLSAKISLNLGIIK